MKKVVKLSLLGLSLLLLVPNSPRAVKAADSLTLKVYSSEDYIYLQDENDPESAPDLIKQFEAYYLETTGKTVEVIYETYDTNETMFNEIKLGRTQYDLVCPSDYMVQRMLGADMLEEFNFNNLPNYQSYASPYLVDRLNEIEATDVNSGTKKNVGNYMVGYMWGTLGFLYNPTFEKFATSGLDADAVHEEMNLWSSIWDAKYKNTFQVKDSMRDTFSLGVMKVFESELIELQNEYKNGEINEVIYNHELTKIFNRSDDETIDLVLNALLELKKNWYGMEVDTGKSDILKGMVGINLAWSGDAVYSMELGVEEGLELYYKVPDNGGNIWFDGWAMPKGANKELAEAFVDFVSAPVSAALNMNYIGYTPFIAGDNILSLTREWYDARYDEETGTIDTTMDTTDLYAFNLDYFFNGTLATYPEDATSYVVYSEEINRGLSAQFPTAEEMTHLAVMADYGPQNDAILKMWEKIKSNNIELWMVITFSALGVAIAGVLIIVLVRRKGSKNRKKHS
ncbi:MAG: extracellular solute-binding protein [Erysipelotrichaceae bacterium]|jgi:spermidine/putrescine transport system substrate-binding protein|nr:extracellular solute-binding protein [Erysipelotrichaceae bacterium]